jgi:hypothetical protein
MTTFQKERATELYKKTINKINRMTSKLKDLKRW